MRKFIVEPEKYMRGSDKLVITVVNENTNNASFVPMSREELAELAKAIIDELKKGYGINETGQTAH